MYSGVTSIEVFEHLRDPLGTLTALSNCITPGGYIFLRTLLHYDDAQRFRTWWYPIDETHITFYHEESLKYLADQCNLSLLSVERGCEIILQKQK